MSIETLRIARFANLLLAGLLAGNELGTKVAVHPSLERLRDGSGRVPRAARALGPAVHAARFPERSRVRVRRHRSAGGRRGVVPVG